MPSILDSIVVPVKLREASPGIIRAVQIELIRVGFSLKPDGICGEKTLAAFKQFKIDNYLVDYEILGSTTAKKLLSAKPKPVNPKTKEDHINLIIAECHRQGVTNKHQIAYVLATVEHETAGTFRPIDEFGGRNTRYSPYWGRGYVQLTWKSNYQKYSEILGRDFVNNPEQVKEPGIAAFILVHGFRTGGFTGRSLADYINGARCDFFNCRRCINGRDKAELIADYAREWVSKLP